MLLMGDFVWGPQGAEMILISSDVLLPLSALGIVVFHAGCYACNMRQEVWIFLCDWCKHCSVICWHSVTDTSSGDVSGSVCILGAATAEAEAAVQRILSKYAEETGFNPYEFRGTSIGASRFGHIRLMRR